MAGTRTTPHGNTAERLSAIEGDVRNIAGSVREFIQDSKDWRNRQEKDVEALWEAQKRQGEAFSKGIMDLNAATSAAIGAQSDKLMGALSALENRSRISWGGIIATVSCMISLVAVAAALGHHQLKETEAKLNVSLESQDKLVDLNRERAQQHSERLRELEIKAAYTEGLRAASQK